MSDRFLATKLVLMLVVMTVIASPFLGSGVFSNAGDARNAVILEEIGRRDGGLWTPSLLGGMPMYIQYNNVEELIWWGFPVLISYFIVVGSLILDGYGLYLALILSLPITVLCTWYGAHNAIGFAMMVWLVNYRKW